MSFFVVFKIDHHLPKSEAKELASRMSVDTGFFLRASVGWFKWSTDCFVTTDSGDVFGESSGLLVPEPGVASQLRGVVATLLEVSSVIVFYAGWAGDDRGTKTVDSAIFANLIDEGT